MQQYSNPSKDGDEAMIAPKETMALDYSFISKVREADCVAWCRVCKLTADANALWIPQRNLLAAPWMTMTGMHPCHRH